jgi:hypothetical protein
MKLRRELPPGVRESGIECYSAPERGGCLGGAPRGSVSPTELELNDGRVALSARERFKHARCDCRLAEPAPRRRQ